MGSRIVELKYTLYICPDGSNTPPRPRFYSQATGVKSLCNKPRFFFSDFTHDNRARYPSPGIKVQPYIRGGAGQTTGSTPYGACPTYATSLFNTVSG